MRLNVIFDHRSSSTLFRFSSVEPSQYFEISPKKCLKECLVYSLAPGGGFWLRCEDFLKGKFDATRRHVVHAHCCSSMRVVRLAAWGLTSQKAKESG